MPRYFDERDLVHVMRMVLGENKGNVLTDALCFGLEISIVNYLKALPDTSAQNNPEGGDET